MTIFTSQFTSVDTIQITVTAKLKALQAALDNITDLYGWSSTVAAGDLENLGMNSTDASTLLSACADANAVAQIYETGLPPSSYPQPASAYVYAATQRQVMGP
jgi:hypothetical protein